MGGPRGSATRIVMFEDTCDKLHAQVTRVLQASYEAVKSMGVGVEFQESVFGVNSQAALQRQTARALW